MANNLKEETFLELFKKYMDSSNLGKPGAFKSLADFLKTLNKDEIEKCLLKYQVILSPPSPQYSAKDKYVLDVFFQLAHLAITKDKYLALRFEVLFQVQKSFWLDSYGTLSSNRKGELRKQIAQIKRYLQPWERKFIVLFARNTKFGNTELEKFLYECAKTKDRLQRFEKLKGCLLVYIEMSLQYPPDNEKSISTFFAFSLFTITHDYGFFAQQYWSWVSTPSTVWASRYAALDKLHAEGKLNKELLDRAIQEKRKAVKVDIEPRNADLPEARKAPQTKKQQEFSRVLDRFMNRRDKAATNELNKFIDALTAKELGDCLLLFLEQSIDNNNNSRYVFFSLLAWAITKGEPYFALKYEWLIHSPGTLWNKWYAELDERHQKVQLDERISIKKTQQARILDHLQFAYFQKYQKDPASLKVLQAFEPVSDSKNQALLNQILNKAEHAYRTNLMNDLLQSFDELANLFQSQNNGLLLLTMIKWCRESKNLDAVVRGEFYWYGVGILYLLVIRSHNVAYGYDEEDSEKDAKRGFNDKERLFFLDGDAADVKVGIPHYRGDFEFRLRDMMLIRKSPTDFTNMSRAHLELLVFGKSLNIDLASMVEAELVSHLIEEQRGSAHLSTIRIPVTSRLAINAGSTRLFQLGQSLGNYTIIWWDKLSGATYLERNGLERVLFTAYSEKLTDLADEDAVAGELWRRTRHLLPIIELFYQACNYLPALLTGGFTGIVKEIVEDLLVSAIAPRVFGDSVTGLIATSILVGRVSDAAVDASRGLTRGTTRQISRQMLDRGTDIFEAQERGISHAAKGATQVEEQLLGKGADAIKAEQRNLSDAATKIDQQLFGRGKGAVDEGLTFIEIGAGDLKASIEIAKKGGAKVIAVDPTVPGAAAVKELEVQGGKFVKGVAADLAPGTADHVFQYFPWQIGGSGSAAIRGTTGTLSGTWSLVDDTVRLLKPNGAAHFVTEHYETAKYLAGESTRRGLRTVITETTAGAAAVGASGAGVPGFSKALKVWMVNIYK